ncbi:fatty-acyl-CoA synthase [Branchiibius hedensis]|uniref:Fatty-acyl-CoA synthase n=1 Tax=Branchiibius hedensis TaxID=672460 RepID=A0A2Y8ZS56_9MICO|nr:acyl-CoA synthetase [Branchiibius hedensis]PWJ23939.1 fatty-acyl-CoA synthase [Branchiibius hedensis]SSA32757.1 fatty-acyl-CoA synthase [Branchiibius hedensis]
MYPGAHIADQADKPAIIHVDTGETRTYAELNDNSIRVARQLRDLGVEVGQDIAFISDNLPQVFEIYWAGVRSGFYVTGVNHHLTAPEAVYILNDCDAQVLFVSEAHRDLAQQLLADVPGLKAAYIIDGEPGGGLASYSEILATTSADPLPDEPRGVDMLYSSGTTGQPKGVKPPLTGKQVGEAGADAFTAVFGKALSFGTDTVYYSCAPTYHAAPLRFGGIVNALGGTVVLANRFDAEAALAAIEKYRATHSQWVPTMFVRMLKLPQEVRDQYDVSSLRVAVHAAAPCPVEVKAAMIQWWGPILFEYYSSTEANGITMVSPQDWLAHPGTVGKAALGTIHICDPSGADLPTGQDGMVYFEREVRPFSYHNDPVKTAAATHPHHDTWTTTGDIGHVDGDGYLYLTDRAAFTIISGGVNIYPQEIENLLALHPAILDVAVIGVPDADLGQSVKAVVQPAEGAITGDDLAQEILTSLEGKLARYKIPRTLDFTDSLPRTATGKLVKGPLVAQYSATVAS